MSATIIAFPFRQVLPRAVFETTIQRLIDLLDARDQSLADLEPDEDCEPADWDDELVAAEWHTCSTVAVRRTSHAKAAYKIRKE